MAPGRTQLPEQSPEQRIATLERRVSRERQARAEAERISERALRELYERNAFLELLLELARLTEFTTLREDQALLRDALARIANFARGDVATLWYHEPATDELVPSKLWAGKRVESCMRFRARSESMTFKRGEGLPGRVLASGSAHIIPELAADTNFPRLADAARDGLNFGLCVPILEQGRVFAVLELLSGEAPTNAGAFAAQVSEAGIQVGLFIARHRTTLRLTEAREAAEEAVQRQREFLGVMTHELRTPLNGILGLTQIMQGDAQDSKALEYLGLIRTSANRLNTLISSMLTFARRERDSIPASIGPFNPCEAVTELAEVAADEAAEKGLNFTVDFDAAVPDIVVGDKPRIKQILMTFLSNAWKFTEVGGVHLRLSLESAEGKTGVLKFTVSDTGPGISEKNLKRIFLPFSQGDQSTTRAQGGVGLGLAIAKRLADRIHGQILLDSEEGKGTVACFIGPFSLEPPTPKSNRGNIAMESLNSSTGADETGVKT